MEGRWKRSLCAAVLAGALGCKTKEAAPPAPFGMQQPQESRFSFLPKAKPTPPPHEGGAAALAAGRTSKSNGVDFIVAYEDARLESAFMEGRSSAERDTLLDAARQGYQQALTRDPKNKAALLGLAKLYTYTGEREKAVATVQAAIKHHPKDHDLAYKLVTIHCSFSDWPAAAEACKHALTLDPENRTYLKTMGVCLAHMDQWQEAGEVLVRVMPEAQARYYLGRILIDEQRLDEARQQMQLALEQDPQFESARHVLADIDAGRATPRENAIQQTGFQQPQQ